MTASLPRQAMPPDEPPGPPEERGHRIRRRALTLLIIVLLIGVPAGYLVISANQSRDSGEDKERKWAARGLTEAWPSKVQRHIYEVPVPRQADGEGILSTKVAYYETNNWRTSRLYVQFMTTNAGLDYFFKAMGVPRTSLKKDRFSISARDQKIVGWEFKEPGPWWGLAHPQKNPAPTQHIVVRWSHPNHYMVYVVSRTTP
ncbi:sugar kinase [Streptomyces sp. NBC_01451]|uniref:sugar kinase n=1 Tax=Streptomyces sp. NBC_01451 TaxID=2903872 RepID=UPI002E35C78C|nr:sugar kinase [Streptomyces sp. NBC_01451]